MVGWYRPFHFHERSELTSSLTPENFSQIVCGFCCHAEIAEIAENRAFVFKGWAVLHCNPLCAVL